jgi:HlyD family secretion protein
VEHWAVGGRLIFILALVLVAGLGAGWWWSNRKTPPIAWQGYADADFIKIGPTQQGLLTTVAVQRGSRVKAGAPLFDQDDTNDRAAHDQAARQLGQAEQQLANLLAGAKPTEIKLAEANLADAEAARDKVQVDLKRNEELVKTGGVSKQVVENQRADLRSAIAKVEGFQAALAQARAPMGREREIMAQKAAVQGLTAAVAMSQWKLDQRHVTAPADGVIADVMSRPGETLAAGGVVVSLLPPENIYVRFFIPEAQLALVHYGDTVALHCDGCPDDLTGTVSFIAPQAEYTPPVIYSETIRSKLVYAAQAHPPRERATLLNPGQPILVKPAAGAAPR